LNRPSWSLDQLIGDGFDGFECPLNLAGVGALATFFMPSPKMASA
jgi:hypothetical protein